MIKALHRWQVDVPWQAEHLQEGVTMPRLRQEERRDAGKLATSIERFVEIAAPSESGHEVMGVVDTPGDA